MTNLSIRKKCAEKIFFDSIFAGNNEIDLLSGSMSELGVKEEKNRKHRIIFDLSKLSNPVDKTHPIWKI